MVTKWRDAILNMSNAFSEDTERKMGSAAGCKVLSYYSGQITEKKREDEEPA